MKKFIYLDIDGVLCLGSETSRKFYQDWGWSFRFNKKAVNVLNEVLDKTEAEIIISSDWKDHYTLKQLGDMFEFYGVKKRPLDTTTSLPYKTSQFLEKDRATEILQHVEKYEPDIWVAIDDLDLRHWINGTYTSIPDIDNEHFVFCTRMMEGIKQTGRKDELIRKLNG